VPSGNVPQGIGCPGGKCDGAGQCTPDCVPDGNCNGLPNCDCLPGKALNEYCYDGNGAFNEVSLSTGCANKVQAGGTDSCGNSCTGTCIDPCGWTCHDGGSAYCEDRGYGTPVAATCTCN
jgi:hypothetical protein